MTDPVLPVVYGAALIMCLVLNGVVLISFQHPDDKNQAYAPKVVVLAGLLLAEATVAALSLDVANGAGSPACTQGPDDGLCGGIDMLFLWELLHMAGFAFVLVVVPFTMFYYEADDGGDRPGRDRRRTTGDMACEAVRYTSGVVIVAALLLFISERYLNHIELPLTEVTVSYDSFETFTMPGGTIMDGLADVTTEEGSAAQRILVDPSRTDPYAHMELTLTPILFITAVLSFVGWILFAVFAGVGLAGLPLDSIAAYVYRPRHMDALEFAEAQLSIRSRTADLVDVGDVLRLEREGRQLDQKKRGWLAKRRDDARDQATLNKFKMAVYVLQNDVQDLKWSHEKQHEYNPLVPLGKLVVGCVSAVLSLLWVLQTALYVLPDPPLASVLDRPLRAADDVFPFAGIVVVMVMALYLLACTVHGNFKVGLRFLWFSVHPMEWNKTYVSSFLFNVLLVLLCSAPVVQFCSLAFGEYTRHSNVQQIFGTQFRHLRFFRYAWDTNAFVICLLVFFGLSLIYFSVRPREDPFTAKKLKKKLAARAGNGGEEGTQA
eukprot:CAMPEP_0194269994 /NCGR_PEP_ID=MMETSP0169-20130528/4077_1 /TAXON_ID=218684 /ORGANISM="Corethron pennatum, Strain L29A3" /LENGTH=546 /DNA_ID=CAMNT_0039011883 /DNA_START=99 /DNA_END=1739 /DNA_ORIENTATION=+